jgi:small subunit ribosomal protein S18
MAPPRFQCLNATRAAVKQSYSLRAGFSTSRIVQAGLSNPLHLEPQDLTTTDDPPRPSTATSSLISSVFGSSSPPPSQSAPSPQRAIPQFSNPLVPTEFRKLQSLHPSSGQTSERVMNLLNKAAERKKRLEAEGPPTTADEVQKYARAADLSKQITRRWKAGDIYAPHDLSGVEMAKWKKRGQPNHDVFDVLDINPMDHYRVRASLPHLLLYVGFTHKS